MFGGRVMVKMEPCGLDGPVRNYAPIDYNRSPIDTRFRAQPY